MIAICAAPLLFVNAHTIQCFYYHLHYTGPEDIHGGNLKLILGLVWTLIKTYQIRFTSKRISTKKAMLTWVDSIIPEYHITNFSTDWNDGRCLCGVVDHIRPGACSNHSALAPAKGLENCQLGMDLAERTIGIPKVIDPVDLNHPNIDELSVMTYLSYFCAPFNTLLLDWIRKKIPENNISNLSTDWNNGINLGALGESCFPGLCPDWKDMDPVNGIKNNERLLGVMKERLGLQSSISAEEMADTEVDKLIIATYLSQFRNTKLKASPEEFVLKIPSLPHGSALVKEPVIFNIEISEHTPNLKNDISVTAHGPSSDVEVDLRSKGEFGLEALLIPTEAGSYDIMAAYLDENISGSPFTLPVADPSKCAIFGDIPSTMQVGEEEMFVVKTRNAGIAQLTCSSEVEDTLSSEIKEQENEQFEIKLTPKETGQVEVYVMWANTNIPRTPFTVNVCNARKASISGTEKEGKVGELFTLQVQAREEECGKGMLMVSPHGPDATYKADVKKEDDGTYDVSFMPWEVGPHKIQVAYGGGLLLGSPFPVNIAAIPDPNTCSASGKGLKQAVAGEEAFFLILSPECELLGKTNPAGLEVIIESCTDQPQAYIGDNADGSYSVSYTAHTPGSYNITIKFYEKEIPGSPFKLDVVQRGDAGKCKAYGPVLHPNSTHIAGNPLEINVDATEAGTGELHAMVLGPEDLKPKVYIVNESGIYSIKWDVPEPGRYQIHIWWAEQYIPGSPFKIKVNHGPNAAFVNAYGPGLEPSFEIGSGSSDFTIETKNAGIGTITVRIHGVKDAFKIQAQPIAGQDMRTLKAFYHPKQAGDYIIAIRWSGTHVPGSPFKVNVREAPTTKQKPLPHNIDTSEQKQTMSSTSGQEREDDKDRTQVSTPLVFEKGAKNKKMKNIFKTQSHGQMVQRDVEPGACSPSTVSLPERTTNDKVQKMSLLKRVKLKRKSSGENLKRRSSGENLKF